jgi:hypothetical protein
VFDQLQRLLPPELVDLLRRQQAALDQTLARSKAPLTTWRSRGRVVAAAPARNVTPIAPKVAREVYDALLRGKRSRSLTSTRRDGAAHARGPPARVLLKGPR